MADCGGKNAYYSEQRNPFAERRLDSVSVPMLRTSSPASATDAIRSTASPAQTIAVSKSPFLAASWKARPSVSSAAVKSSSLPSQRSRNRLCRARLV